MGGRDSAQQKGKPQIRVVTSDDHYHRKANSSHRKGHGVGKGESVELGVGSRPANSWHKSCEDRRGTCTLQHTAERANWFNWGKACRGRRLKKGGGKTEQREFT